MANDRPDAVALRPSEGLFRALFEQSPLSVQVLAPTGETVAVNRAWETLWGVTLAELPGYNVLEDPQLAANGVLPLLRRAFAGEPTAIPPVAYAPDRGEHAGCPRWVSAVASPVRDEAGAVTQVVLIHEDVTDLIAAQEDLARLAAIVESSEDAIISRTLAGTITTWNRGAERLYGYTRDEAAGMHVSALVPPDRQDELTEISERLGRGERMEHFETVRLRKDGSRVDVSISLSPIADAAGRVVGVSTIARDVTERKRAEARYRGLFEGVADAILVADVEGRYLDANPAAVVLLGYTREELLGLRVPDVVAHRPGWTEAEYVRFRDEGHWRGELELRRKDGSLVPVEVLATAVRLPEGPVYLSAVRDVSERRALERMQEDFLAMVGHDLRSPLTALKGQAQLMKRRRAYSEQAVDAILAQVDRMDRLVADLADVVRLEAGRLELARAPIDLVELAREGVEQARLLSPRHPIRVEAPEGPVAAVVDRHRLGQVLQNLLGNAVKYSPAGSEVAVRVSVEDGEARLSVADRGIGVARDQLPRLFERFYRAGVTGAPAGLGLGLYISRMLVEAHGGRIWAQSAPGEGSTFTVALPLTT